MSAVVITPSGAVKPRYRACPAHAFRAEFGVCRGEAISRFEDLSLGDIYQLRHPIDWMPVTASDSTDTEFTLDVAANLPTRQLTTLASMIFMTTTGRRADVLIAFADGQLFLVCETELEIGPEYVLIDIDMRDVTFTPVMVPTPVAPMRPRAANASPIVQLRKLG